VGALVARTEDIVVGMQPAFFFEAPSELRSRQGVEQPHDTERDRGVLDQLDYGVGD
jgi:hypothetical protein